MEARLAKVEVEVDTLKETAVRIEHRLDQLHGDTERRFAEQQQYMERRFAEQQQYMDCNFAEIRRELGATTRWLVGLMLANMSLTIAMLVKVAGLH